VDKPDGMINKKNMQKNGRGLIKVIS